MDLFYSGSPEGIKDLESILSPELVFRGPLYAYDSAREYIDALLSDPPVGMTFEIVESVASENAACLIYEFKKHSVTATMAQFFEVRDGLITKIILVFETEQFL